MACRSLVENLGPTTKLQYSSRVRMIWAFRRSAAACRAWGSATHRKALSFLRNFTPRAAQLLFDEVVTVEVVGDRKGEKGPYAQCDRSQHRVTDVEVIMGEPRAL